MSSNFKFLSMEQPVVEDRQFLNELFTIRIMCEDDDVVSWEEEDGNITNDQTIYIIELLMRHNYLPTDEPIKQVLVTCGGDDDSGVIYVYPQDNNGDLIKCDGVSLYHIIPIQVLQTLQ